MSIPPDSPGRLPVITPGAYRISLGFLAFAMGAIVMSLEMVASRYLTPFFGGAITTWGAIISTVLAALALGYYLGGALADRRPDARQLGLLTLPAAIYVALLPTFAPETALWMATEITDVRLGVLLAALILFCPPLILLGAYSPFVIRLVIRSEHHSGKVSGLIYAISTVGSIIGTLATTFFLIPHFGTRTITLGLAAATLFCAWTLLGLGRANAGPHPPGPALRWSGVGASLVCVLLLGLVFSGAASAAEQRSLLPKNFFGGDDQLAYVESPYNTIIITERGDHRTMHFGYRQRRYTETRINKDDPTELPVPYTKAMTLGLAHAKRADTLLMIGLGGGGTSSYLAHFLPQLKINAVEIDPDVITLAQKYFHIRPSNQVALTAMDGRLFLTRTKKRYDMIMVDAYRGWFVPFHLTTREFYTRAKAALSDGGVLVQNIEPSTLLFDPTMATLSAVFDRVALYKGGYNRVAIAYDGPLQSKPVLQARAKDLQSRYNLRYPLTELLEDAVDADFDADAQVLTDDYAPANWLHEQDRPR